MIPALISHVRFYPMNRWAILICGLYVVVLVTALRTFVLWQSVNFLLGSLALMNATVLRKEKKGSLRYAYAALLLAVISLMLPVKTILFFALGFAVFFMIESFYGRMNILPLFIIIMISPIFQYMTDIFSFPIRLQLTNWAGTILDAAGMQSTVQGNMINYNGNEFTVDPACMGLNMMVTSLLLGIMIIAAYQKKYANTLRLWHIVLLLMVVSGLNIVSNLFRIVCLVQFNILPGTIMHDVVGIICLFIYVILPSIVCIKWMIRKAGRKNDIYSGIIPVSSFPKRLLTMHSLVAFAIVVSSYSIVQHDKKMIDPSRPLPFITGYNAQRISADIVKLENPNSLVYIKAIPGFYSADHNPMICWKGSGYQFVQIQEQLIGGSTVYTATLRNNQDTLYTAWWYDNGHRRTVDQLTWRWDVLISKNNYSVVNVTSSTKEVLEKEIQKIQSFNRFKLLL